MMNRVMGERPLFNPFQLLLLLALVFALFTIVGFQRRANTSDAIEAGRSRVQAEIDTASNHQIELKATLEFIDSDAYVEEWARRGGQIKEGDTIVSPMIAAVPAQPQAQTAPVEPPAIEVYPWQGWWRLLTDAPFPRTE